MTAFLVCAAPEEDIGKDRIRLHYRKRGGTPRFAIVKASSGGKHAFLCVLGHDGAEDEIQMGIDQRARFNTEVGDRLDLTISRATWLQKLRWYLFATDPSVHVPAWLGVWSFALGLLGLIPMLFEAGNWLVSRCWG